MKIRNQQKTDVLKKINFTQIKYFLQAHKNRKVWVFQLFSMSLKKFWYNWWLHDISILWTFSETHKKLKSFTLHSIMTSKEPRISYQSNERTPHLHSWRQKNLTFQLMTSNDPHISTYSDERIPHVPSKQRIIPTFPLMSTKKNNTSTLDDEEISHFSSKQRIIPTFPLMSTKKTNISTFSDERIQQFTSKQRIIPTFPLMSTKASHIYSQNNE